MERKEYMLAYPLLSWFSDVSVGFEEGSDVECLPAPEGSLDGPVKCKLQGSPIQTTEKCELLVPAGWRCVPPITHIPDTAELLDMLAVCRSPTPPMRLAFIVSKH